MIPVAQLDPASLCLWYDPELVSASEGGEIIAEAVHHATFGDLQDVRSVIDKSPNAKVATRAIHLVSSIWHEYRHFLDLILTNYGAFRFRLFSSLYANMGNVLTQQVRLGEKLVCPIDAYVDPVRANLLGIKTKSNGLLSVATNIAARKEWLHEERALIQSRYGLMATGGEAQFEALAYFCQISAVQNIFGRDMSVAVHDDLPEWQRGNLRYKWAQVLGNVAGLLPIDEKSGVPTGDISLICPMLFASLICRKYGQEQAHSGSSGFPALRFAALAQELGGQLSTVGGLDILAAWILINEASERLWGRTILDELHNDYAKEAEWIDKIVQSDSVYPSVRTAVKDLHVLRGRLIELLIKTPTAIIDPHQFTRDVLFQLRPIPIVAAKSGNLGSPPEGWKSVLSYKDPNYQGPEGQWWWAAGPKEWSPDADVFSLKEHKSWLTIASESAPIAKLMLNGRAHRTMLGPELISMEMRLKNEGLELAFDPLFAFPPETNEIASFFELTGKDEAVCDFCRNNVKKPEGYLVSPWIFRYSQRNADLCIKGFGGGQLGQFKYWRDWSDWVFCERCRQRFVT